MKCACGGAFVFSTDRVECLGTLAFLTADCPPPRSALTCVGHHQPAPGASEHRGRLLPVSAGSQRGLGGKEGFASSAQRGPHRPVIRSQAPRKCLGVGRDMILCPFCNPWRAGGRTNNLISARDRDTDTLLPFFS